MGRTSRWISYAMKPNDAKYVGGRMGRYESRSVRRATPEDLRTIRHDGRS